MSSRVTQAEPDCGCAARAQSDPFLSWVGRLVHDHRGGLLAVARAEGLGAEDAFDVVQEAFGTFLTLPAARSLVDARDDSRFLLVAVTRNLARNRRRLAAVARPHDGDLDRLAELPAPGRTIEDLLAAAEDQVRLRGCVASLGELQRAVVTLRMLDEIDGQDVAGALGITPGNVAVLLHRAKANLLTCMTNETERNAS
ncbi:MAG TPA: sigma-70 family RNA polymerase sigma factor [Polyangia bacterium]|nr:sigma-70 family RNA polymerase sigma factor [Polyangia bacterium]